MNSQIDPLAALIAAGEAAAKTIAKVRLGIREIDYVAHWIRNNSREERAVEIANLALKGLRLRRNPLQTKDITLLKTPEYFWVGENNRQFWAAYDVANSLGHLWAMWATSGKKTIRDVLYSLCDHINGGNEDYSFGSRHDTPTPIDSSGSHRFSWEVFPDGTVKMDINRPSGVACTIKGIIGEPDTIRIRFNGKLVERRHLHYCHQRLTDTFQISNDDAIRLIEDSKDFRSTGFRYVEIASLELDKYIN